MQELALILKWARFCRVVKGHSDDDVDKDKSDSEEPEEIDDNGETDRDNVSRTERRRGAKMIQNKMRTIMAERLYSNTRKAVTLLAAWARGWMVRRHIRLQEEAERRIRVKEESAELIKSSLADARFYGALSARFLAQRLAKKAYAARARKALGLVAKTVHAKPLAPEPEPEPKPKPEEEAQKLDKEPQKVQYTAEQEQECKHGAAPHRCSGRHPNPNL